MSKNLLEFQIYDTFILFSYLISPQENIICCARLDLNISYSMTLFFKKSMKKSFI